MHAYRKNHYQELGVFRNADAEAIRVAYRALAKKCSKIWLEHGALEVKECVADDVPYGKRTSFPLSVKQKPNETVIFSYKIGRAHV